MHAGKNYWSKTLYMFSFELMLFASDINVVTFVETTSHHTCIFSIRAVVACVYTCMVIHNSPQKYH